MIHQGRDIEEAGTAPDPASPTDSAEGGQGYDAGLSPPVREHLAKQLRATYQLVADKPAFLGDPAIPVEFDRQIQRLETREKAHEHGIEAVKTALHLDDEEAAVKP